MSWTERRPGMDKVTSGLQAATSALSRAVEAKDPSHLTVLRVLLQCQEAMAGAEASIAAFSPGQAFVEAVRLMALSALWCALRLGARGGPIRRRALDVIRRSGALAGSFTLLQVINDLRKYMIAKDSGMAGKDIGISSGPTVMAELVRTTVNISREDASDVIEYILSQLAKDRSSEEEATTAAASIIVNCMVGRGLDDRVIERAVAFMLDVKEEIPVASALLAIALAPHLKYKGSAAQFLAGCIDMLAGSTSDLEVKVWSIALALSTATCIALEMPAGMKLANLGKAQFDEALARVVEVSGMKEGREGAHWVLVSVIHLWRKTVGSTESEDFIVTVIQVMTPYVDTYEGLILANEAIFVGLLNGLTVSRSLRYLDVLLPMINEVDIKPTARGLACAAAAEIVRNVGHAIVSIPARVEKIIEGARVALMSASAFVQESGAALLTAVASAVPLRRSEIVMETIQRLRLSDAELAANPTRNETLVYVPDPPPNWYELQNVTGSSLALALLLSEATSYPGVPGALLESGLECAISLLERHPLTSSEPAGVIKTRRRRAGWALLTALSRSSIRSSLIIERLPQLLPLWIDELSSLEDPSGSLAEIGRRMSIDSRRSSRSLSGDPGKMASSFQSEGPLMKKTMRVSFSDEEGQARAAAMAALSSALQVARTRDLEVVGVSLVGAEAARVVEATTVREPDAVLDAVVRRLLGLTKQLSPIGPSGDLVYHIALTAESRVVKEREKSLKASKTKDKYRKTRKEVARENLRWRQNDILALFNTLNARNTDPEEMLTACADAVAAIVCQDVGESADFLDDLVEKRIEVSPAFGSAISYAVASRLSVNDFSSDGGILVSLQILLRRALTTELEKLHVEPPALSSIVAFFGRSSKPEPVRTTHDADATVAVVAEAYRELGRKGGDQLWAGLVISLSDVLTKAVSPQPALASAVARILGQLLNRMETEKSTGESSREQEALKNNRLQVERIGFVAIADALERGQVETQAAAATALNGSSLVVADLADRLLCSLFASMLFERGSSSVQVHLSEVDMTHAGVDPEGSGDYLADIGEGAAQVLMACRKFKGKNTEESVIDSAKEIAAELIAWRLDRAPRTRASGLQCLAGIWGALNTAPDSSKEEDAKDSRPSRLNSDPLERFWSQELPKRAARTAIAETLNYKGGRELTDARNAAVNALQELISGVGTERVLLDFPEIPEALFNAVRFGCEAAARLLEAVGVTDAPGRFGFWFQLCKEVSQGGFRGLRASGEGSKLASSELKAAGSVVLTQSPSQSSEKREQRSVAKKRETAPSTAQFERWPSDSALVATALRTLRLCIDSYVASKPEERTRPPNVAEWTCESLEQRLEPVCSLVCAVCSTIDVSVKAAVEGSMIMRSIASTFLEYRDKNLPGSPRVLPPHLERMSAILVAQLTTPQMPEVVRASALASSGIILSAAEDPDFNVDDLIKALLGSKIESLHKRFQYDRLTEEAGARTTLSVLSTIGMVISETLIKKIPTLLTKLDPYLAPVYRLFIAFCGDFAEMFVSGAAPLSLLGGALTAAGTQTDFIQSSFVKHSADIIFAAGSMRLLLGEKSFQDEAADGVEWLSPESSGAILGRNTPEYLFHADTRDLLLSLIHWWLTVGFRKTLSSFEGIQFVHDQILSRCFMAVQSLRKWPCSRAVDPILISEILTALSAVNPVIGARLGLSMMSQEEVDGNTRTACMATCVRALEEAGSLDLTRSKDTEKLAEAVSTALSLLRGDEPIEDRRNLAGAVLHCFFGALERTDLSDRSRSSYAEQVFPVISPEQSVIADLGFECSAISRRFMDLHVRRVKDGLETPSSAALHLQLACRLALEAKSNHVISSNGCMYVALQMILFGVSSAASPFVSAALALNEVQEVIGISAAWVTTNPSQAPLVGRIWSRIGEWALRFSENAPTVPKTATHTAFDSLVNLTLSTKDETTVEVLLSILLPALNHRLHCSLDLEAAKQTRQSLSAHQPKIFTLLAQAYPESERKLLLG